MRSFSLLRLGASLLAAITVAVTAGATRRDAAVAGEPPGPREAAFATRPFRPVSGDRWIGNAVAYGPFRDGQRPGGPAPARDEVAEDLGLMAKHWSLLRVYSAEEPTETLLELIRENGVDMKVLLGAWIDVEDRRDSTGAVVEEFPAAAAANRREIESAIRLAGAYPEIVIGICVGNETQVFWSSHRVPPETLIGHIRRARAGTTAPVTTADDFNFWNKPESRAVADEIDFIVMHAHPLWNGLQLEDALDWTKRTVASIQAAHPGKTVVLGETGWATRRHTEGDQAKLMKGKLGEEEQAAFYREVRSWVSSARVPTFFFEAFDENWKGGGHPDEVEKHWGLFRADRTPKPALVAEE